MVETSIRTFGNPLRDDESATTHKIAAVDWPENDIFQSDLRVLIHGAIMVTGKLTP